MLAGVDTGFFFAMEEGNANAIAIWKEREIATSAIVIYELQKKLLQGRFPNWRSIISDIETSTTVIPVDTSIAVRAGGISHEFGIPGLDSLIIASLLEAGAGEIYTTDAHFSLYSGGGCRIINLAA